ncbi:MAG: hypothetical protein FVQ80_18925 [Planctomycetes bacterium]|nr:hypothetical protein [Planctomycetota bacterium]
MIQIARNSDCEQRGIKRLAERLKKAFPHLSIMLLLDGMFASGPAMGLCLKSNWEFMIVLQDKSLPQIWQEYKGLKKLLEEEDRFEQSWADRRQKFHWINDIEYTYGANARNRLTVHLVICEESWEEVDPVTGETITKHSRHAWLSSKPLSRGNVHQRCNLGARYRLRHRVGNSCRETSRLPLRALFLLQLERHEGLPLPHAHRPPAERAGGFFHQAYQDRQRERDAGFHRFVRQTLSGRWLEGPEVQRRLRQPFQLCFV